jgi:hypothetical protein
MMVRRTSREMGLNEKRIWFVMITSLLLIVILVMTSYSVILKGPENRGIDSLMVTVDSNCLCAPTNTPSQLDQGCKSGHTLIPVLTDYKMVSDSCWRNSCSYKLYCAANSPSDGYKGYDLEPDIFIGTVVDK